MPKNQCTIQREYKVHVLDISDLVQYYETSINHYIESYILSHGDVNPLFDFCVHKAISYIVGHNLPLNGSKIQGAYIDHDVYDCIFRDITGEYFINNISYKLKNFSLLNYSKPMHKIGNEYQSMYEVNVIKLIVLGNALWIFEGIK